MVMSNTFAFGSCVGGCVCVSSKYTFLFLCSLYARCVMYCITLFMHRFVASFSYYGSVLSGSELLEKNLLCMTDADPEHQIKHNQEEALCYCLPYNMADYQTLLISCLGEVARE